MSINSINIGQREQLMDRERGIMGTETISFRVLMLPWLAHGHITPFLDLAKKISKKNFYVYLCSTPINLSSIKKKINEKESLSVQLVELHLPSLPELPPQYHTTNGLPLHLNSTLKKAFEMASPDFLNILQTINPDFFINDLMQPWATALASSLNIPTLWFLTSGAAMCSFFSHAIMKKGVEYPFSALYLRDFEAAKLLPAVNSAASENERGKSRESENPQKACKIMLIKSFKELEGKYITYLSDLLNRKVLPLGPLVQDPADEDEQGKFIEWLDEKDKSSTVFVSFGSEYFLSKEEIEEIALGLEHSHVNFIWVIRFPKGENITIKEVLPEGFIERVEERGVIVEGWAPQAKILRHRSTGGFLSHCGWNSLMESLTYGVPIIAMPMHLDQPLNARLVMEVGVGVEVIRDTQGRPKKEEVAKAIKEVFFEKTGEDLKRKAQEMCKTIKLKEDLEINEFVQEVTQLCGTR